MKKNTSWAQFQELLKKDIHRKLFLLWQQEKMKDGKPIMKQFSNGYATVGKIQYRSLQKAIEPGGKEGLQSKNGTLKCQTAQRLRNDPIM